jgi:hypothetical protein
MYDFMMDAAGDMQLRRGDFDIGFSDFQHAQDLIEAAPGEIQLDYDAGVGARRFLSGRSDVFISEIKRQFKRQDIKATNVKVVVAPDGTNEVYLNILSDENRA